MIPTQAVSGPRLAVVTASTNFDRARACIESWTLWADRQPLNVFLILNGVGQSFSGPLPVLERTTIAYVEKANYLGSVQAFRLGVDAALQGPYDVIACLHDDFEIKEKGWDTKVIRAFDRQPQLGLCGFGGAIGLGAADMYQKPYDPMSLARCGFRSDLTDAEVHGVRSRLPEQVACLDGFSQIGRRAFWKGEAGPHTSGSGQPFPRYEAPWQLLEDLGIVHHLYDSLLGAIAARNGWETWYLPLRSTHHGGRTAVGDPGYQEWAKSHTTGGDADFWSQAHALGYENFRDVLPLRV